MKKLYVILFALCIGLSSSIYAVEVDSSNVSKNTVKSVLTDSTNLAEGKAILKQMVVGTGDAMKTGYDIVIKQQYVYAFEYSCVGLLALLTLIGFFIFYGKVTDDKKNVLIPAFLCLGLFIWSAIVFSLHFNVIVQGFVNPDYAAIKDIIQMSKELLSK